MDVRMAVYGAAAAAIARVPHVMTMHGNQKMTAVWRRRAALRLAFRHGGTTAAVSLATKRQPDEDLGRAERGRREFSVGAMTDGSEALYRGA